MTLIGRFSTLPSEARRLGLDYFDLFITNWGQRANGFGSNDVTYPQLGGPTTLGEVLPSVAGIAIHPNSDFDRCLIRANPGQENPTGGGPSLAFTSRIDRHTTALAVDAPYIMSAPSVQRVPGRIVSSSIESSGTLTILADPTTEWRTNYVKAGDTAPTTFWQPGFMPAPILALRFFLRGLSGPLGRAPAVFPVDRVSLNSASLGGFLPIGVAGTEALIGAFPVFGRKEVRVVAWLNGGASTVNVRVGAVHTQIGDLDQSWETTVATASGITTTSPTMVASPGSAGWIAVYVTPLVSAGGSIYLNVYAT